MINIKQKNHKIFVILFCIFNKIKKGFYIDIGANDPDAISVTKALYLRGWNGVNIEPLPDKYNSLKKKRPKDINLKIGVGKKKGKTTFYVSGTMSTVQKAYVNKTKKSIIINIDTMSDICKTYIPNITNIHFCKIDIEGEEKNALLGFDFKNYRPNVFLIESTSPGSNIPTYISWEYILLNNNYSFIYQYKINRYYIDNKIPELRAKFINLDYYIKLYKTINKNK